MGEGPSKHHHVGVPTIARALLLWAFGALDTQEQSPERQTTQLIHHRAGRLYARGATQ